MVLGELLKLLQNQTQGYMHYGKRPQAPPPCLSLKNGSRLSLIATITFQRHSQRLVMLWRKALHYRAVPRQSSGFLNRYRQLSPQGGLHVRHGLKPRPLLPLSKRRGAPVIMTPGGKGSLEWAPPSAPLRSLSFSPFSTTGTVYLPPTVSFSTHRTNRNTVTPLYRGVLLHPSVTLLRDVP